LLLAPPRRPQKLLITPWSPGSAPMTSS